MSTFHGRFALGQKTDSLQEPGLLGDERDDVAMRYDADTDMYYVINSGRLRLKWVQNTSGGALKPGSLVSADASGNMDTDVIQATAGTVPCGIVDPFLTSDVADDERFLIVTKASRVPVLSGAAFSKGAVLVSDSAGKAVLGIGSRMRALAAASGADVLVDAAVDFSAVGDSAPTQARVLRMRVTTAQVNAGHTLLPAIPGFAYRMHDASMISIGGNAGGATAVRVVGTQSSSAVALVSNTVGALTANTRVLAGITSNSSILTGGASFVANDANTAITIDRTVADLTGSTNIDVLLTYELVAV